MTLPRILLAAAVLAGACHGAMAEPLKIRASYVVPVNDWPTILFAKPELAHHLGKSYTFEPVHFQGTPQMVQALAAGELEIAGLTFSSFAIAVTNAGMSDLRVIADGFQDGVPGYYTGQDYVLNDSGIAKVEDLKGKVLASNANGSAVDIALRVMLRKHGLDDKRDVTIIEAPFPQMGAMLLQHKVALITGTPPFVFEPTLQAAARPLFTQADAVGATQMVVWAAKEEFLRAHHAALADFMEDAIRAERWFLDPSHHTEAVTIAAEASKQPPARWQNWLFLKKGEAGDFYRDPDGRPNLDALQKSVDLQAELGFVKGRIDVHKYADLSLVDEAVKRLK